MKMNIHLTPEEVLCLGLLAWMTISVGPVWLGGTFYFFYVLLRYSDSDPPFGPLRRT